VSLRVRQRIQDQAEGGINTVPDDLIDAHRAARVIRVAVKTFRNWVKDGKVLPTVRGKPGHPNLYSAKTVEQIVRCREKIKRLRRAVFPCENLEG
jgi:hypothetical protein